MEPIGEVERAKKRYKISLNEILSGELTELLKELSSKSKIEFFHWDGETVTIKTFKKTGG